MFFSIAWRNAKRSRSENLIYFLTMVTAIATFYIVLSLGEQDVMRFLSELESDAVDRLLTKLLPTVYLCALLFVFSLVIFANKYQLECRSRELGLYLLFGMTKPRLFIQIMAYQLSFGSFRRSYLWRLFVRDKQSCYGTTCGLRYYCTSIKFFHSCCYFDDARIFDYPVCRAVCPMRKTF